MANAFFVLSLKRNRSTHNQHSSSSSTSEPISKLSKLRSGFSIFSKKLSIDSNSSKLIGLFQYFRSNDDHCSNSSLFDNDRQYEYSHYQTKKKQQKRIERNIHTLPVTTAKKLTSILIKRSGTTPSSAYINKSHTSSDISGGRRKRTWSNATISNMTINSEDLTAREFADIAGISILPEEEVDQPLRRYKSNEHDDDQFMHTISSRCTTNERLSVLSYTSLSSYSTNKLKIWNSEFWVNPEVSTSRSNSTSRSLNKTNLARKPSAASSISKKAAIVEPAFLHELRRMNSNNQVIKKGRFEIHLQAEQEVGFEESKENHHTLSFSDNDSVLEWKRRGKKPLSIV